MASRWNRTSPPSFTCGMRRSETSRRMCRSLVPRYSATPRVSRSGRCEWVLETVVMPRRCAAGVAQNVARTGGTEDFSKKFVLPTATDGCGRSQQSSVCGLLSRMTRRGTRSIAASTSTRVARFHPARVLPAGSACGTCKCVSSRSGAFARGEPCGVGGFDGEVLGSRQARWCGGCRDAGSVRGRDGGVGGVSWVAGVRYAADGSRRDRSHHGAGNTSGNTLGNTRSAHQGAGNTLGNTSSASGSPPTGSRYRPFGYIP
jgi:hypothetical protein